jgi:hypothetical protein
VGRTPDRVRGLLFIFRKIHLYGKTKKSTHGHQTTKPFCTHSPFPAVADSTWPAESIATGPVTAGRLGGPPEGFPRVATLYTYPVVSPWTRLPRPHERVERDCCRRYPAPTLYLP